MLSELLSGNLTLETAIVHIIAILAIVFLVLPIHEFAHAGAAYLLGDKSIKQRGRLTFNPLSHVDPFGALCLLLLGFGWAKPVPIDPRNFKSPKVGMSLSALAGPLSNILCGFLSGAAIILAIKLAPKEFFLYYYEIGEATATAQFFYYLILFLHYFLVINVSLAVFNLIPLPPLDGSKVLFAFLPYKAINFINQLERYSFILIYGVIILISRSGYLNVIDDFFIRICLFGNDISELIYNGAISALF